MGLYSQCTLWYTLFLNFLFTGHTRRPAEPHLRAFLLLDGNLAVDEVTFSDTYLMLEANRTLTSSGSSTDQLFEKPYA